MAEFGVKRYMILSYKSEVINAVLEEITSWIRMGSPKMKFEK